jgi:hypothetical protein
MGFKPTARTPSAASCRRIAAVTAVLPTPVLVPVMNTLAVMLLQFFYLK